MGDSSGSPVVVPCVDQIVASQTTALNGNLGYEVKSKLYQVCMWRRTKWCCHTNWHPATMWLQHSYCWCECKQKKALETTQPSKGAPPWVVTLRVPRTVWSECPCSHETSCHGNITPANGSWAPSKGCFSLKSSLWRIFPAWNYHPSEWVIQTPGNKNDWTLKA